MNRPKKLVIYCHHADEKELKAFFKKKRYKTVVIVQEFVERGTCLCEFEKAKKSRTLFPTLHRENGVHIIIPHFFNKSTIHSNCSVQILENTENEDISIGFFREIEG